MALCRLILLEIIYVVFMFNRNNKIHYPLCCAEITNLLSCILKNDIISYRKAEMLDFIAVDFYHHLTTLA
jgi:hypothetical protein